MEAPQILLDAEEWLATVNINASTHHENCHKRHSSCMIQRLAEGFRKTLAEIEDMQAVKTTPKTIKRSARSG